jgi:bifunctional DNA-binding transcriptional regulator/antitoxin component of YhaV-PrlF toxin-antitoxin module
MRSRASKGFRVVVPRELRESLGLAPGDFPCVGGPW